MSNLTFVDVTLRDGNHSIRQQFTPEIAAKVARTAGDGGTGSYFYWATNEWSWFKNSGMINAQNLINDGLTTNCLNNGQTTWTYNQGVVLGGLTELYKTTGDTNYLVAAETIANAAIANLTSGGVYRRNPATGVAPTFPNSRGFSPSTWPASMTRTTSRPISIFCPPMPNRSGSTTATVPTNSGCSGPGRLTRPTPPAKVRRSCR